VLCVDFLRICDDGFPCCCSYSITTTGPSVHSTTAKTRDWSLLLTVVCGCGQYTTVRSTAAGWYCILLKGSYYTIAAINLDYPSYNRILLQPTAVRSYVQDCSGQPTTGHPSYSLLVLYPTERVILPSPSSLLWFSCSDRAIIDAIVQPTG
jgi:hypothetical protein